jgi:hypothetical protein
MCQPAKASSSRCFMSVVTGAGVLAAVAATAAGALFGSDNFIIGGTGDWLVENGTSSVTDKKAISGTTDAQLFSHFRAARLAGVLSSGQWAHIYRGFHAHRIPRPSHVHTYFCGNTLGHPAGDGKYEVMLGFLEPDSNTASGDRVFNVTASGETQIENFDSPQEAGTYRTVVTRTFAAEVSGGHPELNFTPTRGEAVVSNIMITLQ